MTHRACEFSDDPEASIFAEQERHSPAVGLAWNLGSQLKFRAPNPGAALLRFLKRNIYVRYINSPHQPAVLSTC